MITTFGASILASGPSLKLHARLRGNRGTVTTLAPCEDTHKHTRCQTRLQEELEAAEKAAAELAEEREGVKREAAEAAAKAADAHALEVQRRELEQSKAEVGGRQAVRGSKMPCAHNTLVGFQGVLLYLGIWLLRSGHALTCQSFLCHTHPPQAAHQDALAALHSELQAACAAADAVREELAAKAAEVEAAEGRVAELTAELEEARGQLGGSGTCEAASGCWGAQHVVPVCQP